MASDVQALGELFAEQPRNGLMRPKAVRGAGTKMVNMGELFAHPRLRNAAMDRVPLGESEAERFLLEPGDLLFARQSLVLEGAGKCSIFLEDDEPVTFESHVTRVRLDRSKADPGFYFYYFQSPGGRAAIRSIVEQGAGAAGIRGTDLAFLSVVRRPLEEQRAIAGILGALDDKIELNRRMNQTLEAIAGALFKSWFVDFEPVRAKSRGRDPNLPVSIADLFPDRLEASELGEIPSGWRVVSLGQLFDREHECVLTGPFGSKLHAHDYRQEGVPLILVKHVVGGHIVDQDLPLVGPHKLPELDRYRLQLGDIVFTRVGAVGRSAYVHPPNVGWLISGQMLRIRVPDWELLHPRYLSQLFLETTFTQVVEAHALGTTRPSLNTRLLLDLRFVLPPAGITRFFAETVSALDAKVESNAVESKRLVDLRNTLLPKLISGEIRLRDALPLGEPAV